MGAGGRQKEQDQNVEFLRRSKRFPRNSQSRNRQIENQLKNSYAIKKGPSAFADGPFEHYTVAYSRSLRFQLIKSPSVVEEEDEEEEEDCGEDEPAEDEGDEPEEGPL